MLYEILKCFAEFCDQNGLRYYFRNGAALTGWAEIDARWYRFDADKATQLVACSLWRVACRLLCIFATSYGLPATST